MARKVITQDDVFKAAMELVNSGEHPSTLKISQLLGRGSYSTITKYLRAWEETSEAQSARIDALPQEAQVPDTLMNDTQGLAKKLWHSAKTIAEDQLDIERQALEKAKEDYQAEIEQAINMADAATTKKEELDELLNETVASLATSDAKVEKQGIALSATETALTKTEQTLEQLRTELKTVNAEKLAIQETAISNDAALKGVLLQKRVWIPRRCFNLMFFITMFC